MSHQPKPTIIIPRQEATTSQQVVTLLGILQNMVGPLIHHSEALDSDQPALDGGVKMSMESVAIRACDRLNDILDDTSRWNLAGQRTLEGTLTEYYKAQIDALNEQRNVALEVQTPHHLYQPKIVHLQCDLWAAMLGSSSHGLVGIGKSPREAIQSFDAIFEGTELPPVILEYLKKHEQALRDSSPLPPFPKNENTQSLDTNSTGTTNRAQTAGEDGAGNREGDGQDDQSGASPTGADTDPRSDA